MIGVWQRLPITNHSKLSFASLVEDQAICEPVDEPIRPIPQQIALPEQKVELGEKLFHDPQLSHNNTISCASCHHLNTGGTDRRIRSLGINGVEGVSNAPYFHDGSAECLEDAVVAMAKYQLGRPLSTKEVDLIVTFLQTLTGEYKRK